jgi:hypothetical protein
MNLKTMSIAVSLMLIAYPGLPGAYEVRSTDDTVRTVPKKPREDEGQKTGKEQKEKDPKNNEKKEEPKNGDKGSGGDEKPRHTHKEKYTCGTERVCPDGNNATCWDKPVWCTREVPD